MEESRRWATPIVWAYLVTKKSPATVNVALAVIQTALEDAFNDGLVDANEAARVKKLDKRTKGYQQRRAFTLPELSKPSCLGRFLPIVVSAKGGTFVGISNMNQQGMVRIIPSADMDAAAIPQNTGVSNEHERSTQ